MPKLTLLKQQVRSKEEEHEEGRGEKAPVLLAARGKGLLQRLGSAGRGYALAGAGVVVAAVVAVSLLSWLAPDSDRPIASPLEAVGRVAGEVIEQVDDQVEALVGTYGENTVLRSVREGLATASSATPWLSGKSDGIDASPSSSAASSGSASSSTDDAAAAAPSRGESSSTSDGTPPSQPASSTPSPSGSSETPTSTDAPSPPTASEPAPPVSEEPPVAEEPATPPPSAEPPPAAEEPVPPSTEEPPPATEEPPPATEEPPPPVEGPPETSVDE